MMVLLILKYMIRARKQRTQWFRNLLIALFLSGTYFASAVHFLRSHGHEIVLQYWEYVLGYCAVSGIIGLVAVQILRGNAKDRHRVAVTVKWIIRSIAIAILYNSTPSPFGSLTLLSLTVLLYLTYVMYKPKNVFPVGEQVGDGPDHRDSGTVTTAPSTVPATSAVETKKDK